MPVVILKVHPIIQLIAIPLAVYVLSLGLQRFRSVHLGQKTTFNWQRHTLLGKIALILLLGGFAGGMSLVYYFWRTFLLTGLHGKIALVIAPLALFGLGSGWYMDSHKQKRTTLNLIHGIVNCIVVMLACFQLYTGWLVVKLYLLAG